MKLIITALAALTIAGCSTEKKYTCIGDAEHLVFNELSDIYKKNRQPPILEKLVPFNITVTDKFIDVDGRILFAKEAFSPKDFPETGWLEIGTSRFPGVEERAESRKFHIEGKVFSLHYQDLVKGYIYMYKGQCK